MPFAIQLGMYLTPVLYPATFIPERYRWLLALNPVTAVIEGFRWTLLGTKPPSLTAVGVSLVVRRPSKARS